MNKRLHHVGIGIATLVVAFLLSLQVSIGAFAAGAPAPMLDEFGNPLCITGMHGDEGAAAPGKEHSQRPECCMLACGMALGFAPAVRTAAVFLNPLAGPSQRMPDRHQDDIRPALDTLPGHPRAPPAAV